MHTFDTEIIAMTLIKQLRHALEIYSQDPGFDQNMVRNSEKRNIYRIATGKSLYEGHSAHAYRTTHHVVVSRAFTILSCEKLFLLIISLKTRAN